MRPRYPFALWLLLLGLLPQTGCLTLKDATIETTSEKTAATATIEGPPLAHFGDSAGETLCLSLAGKFETNKCWGEAAAQLEKARTMNPKLDVSHRLALVYEKMGDYPRALAEYNKELAAKPVDTDVLNNLLTGLKRVAGQTTPEPNKAEVLNDLGYCLFLKGDYAESEKALRDALEKNPQLAAAWGNLGLTLAALDRVDESLEAFSHTIKPAPAHCNIAFVQLNRGKLAQAKESFHKTLELDPDNELASHALTELTQAEKKEAAKPAVEVSLPTK